MKKRLSVFIVCTLVLTLLAPFAGSTEAASELNWRMIKNIQGGTELTWTTVSDGSSDESFIVQKEDKQLEVSAELVDELKGRSSTERTYKWTDTDVKEGETSVYTVLLTENIEIKTSSVPVTYNSGSGEVKLPGGAEDIDQDFTFVLNARNEGSTIVVSWPEYKSDQPVEYILFMESEALGKYTEASEYILSDTEKGKEYRFKVNVLVGGKVQETKETSIKAEGTQNSEFTVFLYPQNENTIDASWIYDQAASYNLFLNGKLIVEKTNELSYRFDGLSPDTVYEVTVEGLDKKGTVLSKSSANTKTSPAPEGKKVDIKDKALEKAIQEQLGLRRALLESDMKKLSTLTVSGAEDLAGLETATNLVRLEVTEGHFDHLNPLAALGKLEYLDLSFTESDDYTALTNLSSLNTLNLSGSSIRDLSVVKNLVQLKLLNVSITEVSALEALESLDHLEELDISYTAVESIKSLESISALKKVIFYGPQALKLIDEINYFSNEKVEFFTDENLEIFLESIKPLDNGALLSWSYEGSGKLDHYKVTVNEKSEVITSKKRNMTYEIVGLEPDTTYTFKLEAFDRNNSLIGTASWFFKTLKMPNGEKISFKDKKLEAALKDYFGFDRDIVKSDMEHLTEIDLSGMEIKNLTGLEHAANLHSLMIPYNEIKSIKPIEELRSLHTLSLEGNPVSDYRPLNNLSKLTYLDLSYTGIKDLSVLSGQSDLQGLILAGNGLKSLQGLPEMGRLQTLVVAENSFSNLESLKKYQNLAHLILWDNPLKSLSGLEEFEELVYLDIGMTKISDIKDLRKLKKLQYVNLSDIPTLDLTYDSESRKIVKELEGNNVYVEYNSLLELYSSAVTENSISVEWEKTGEMDVHSYQVSVNGELIKGAEALDSNERSYNIKGLSEKTVYQIELAAMNKKGKIIEKVAIEEKTLAKPTTPKITFKDKTLEKHIKEQLGINRQLHEEDMLRLYMLELENSSVKDLTELKFAENLEWFSVINNASPLDLSPLSNLKALSGISIDETIIKDFSVLENMSIFSLEIYNTELADLSFMASMANLEFAELSGNQISDLSVLASNNLDQLTSLGLSDNKIKDTAGLEGLTETLIALDLSRNPLVKIGELNEMDNLAFLSLSKTLVDDIEFLLSLSSLEFVSLYGMKNLDFNEGTKAFDTIKLLQEKGIVVEYDFTSSPEIYLDAVTDSSISISWDGMLPDKDGEYLVLLNEELVDTLEGDKLSFTFEGLDSETDYSIEVMGLQDGEVVNAAYLEASTLAAGETERMIKEAKLFFADEDGNAAVNVEFDLLSLDNYNEEFYSFGTSNNQGQLMDLTGENPKGTFDLLVGRYELYAVTEDGREYVYRFEINAADDYLNTPLVFLVEAKHDEGTSSDNEGENPVIPVNSEGNVIKPVNPMEEKELPNTSTASYNLLLMGVFLLTLGTAALKLNKRL